MSDEITLQAVDMYRRSAQDTIANELVSFLEATDHLLQVEGVELEPIYTAGGKQVGFEVDVRIRLR